MLGMGFNLHFIVPGQSVPAVVTGCFHTSVKLSAGLPVLCCNFPVRVNSLITDLHHANGNCIISLRKQLKFYDTTAGFPVN